MLVAEYDAPFYCLCDALDSQRRCEESFVSECAASFTRIGVCMESGHSGQCSRWAMPSLQIDTGCKLCRSLFFPNAAAQGACLSLPAVTLLPAILFFFFFFFFTHDLC